MKDLADRLKLDRPGSVAEAVADLRKECRERLRDEAGLICNDEDVVANQNRGYHLRDWIKVLDGFDAAEAAAKKQNIPLSEAQKGVLRLLRKHEVRTPRSLSDALSLPSVMLAKEVEGLARAGLVTTEGNGPNKKIRLTATAQATAAV